MQKPEVFFHRGQILELPVVHQFLGLQTQAHNGLSLDCHLKFTVLGTSVFPLVLNNATTTLVLTIQADKRESTGNQAGGWDGLFMMKQEPCTWS